MGVELAETVQAVLFENLLEFVQASVEVRGADKGALAQAPAEQKFALGDKVVFSAPAARVYLFEHESGDRIR